MPEMHDPRIGSYHRLDARTIIEEHIRVFVPHWIEYAWLLCAIRDAVLLCEVSHKLGSECPPRQLFRTDISLGQSSPIVPERAFWSKIRRPPILLGRNSQVGQ